MQDFSHIATAKTFKASQVTLKDKDFSVLEYVPKELFDLSTPQINLQKEAIKEG